MKSRKTGKSSKIKDIEVLPSLKTEEEEKDTSASTHEEQEDVVIEPKEEDESIIEVVPELVLDAENETSGIEVLPAAEPEAEELEKSSSKDLVPYDALSAYLREIRRFERLTKEEETALAIKYFNEKDMEAAYKLISSNLWLVVKIARDYERAARSVLDLIQEGNIGLMEAVKNFDPFRSVRFPSYAVWWIKAYIVRYVIANWRLVKIGTTQAQRKLFFNLKKEKERLEREGFYPAPKLLADSLQVKESEIIEMEQRLSGSDLSVDTPLNADDESNLLSILPGQESNAEDILASKEMKELIDQSMDAFEKTLNENEKVIFRERMLSEDKVTLQDVAVRLDLSRERIRQIENKIRDKLKEYLKDRLVL